MRRFLGWLLLLLLLTGVFVGAFAEEASTAVGVLQEARFLRAKPQPNALVIGQIPAGLALQWSPLSNGYAEITYEGKTGYIYVKDALPADLSIQNLPESYTAYAEEVVTTFIQPIFNGDADLTLPAYTPVTVFAVSGGFAVAAVSGRSTYIPLSLLRTPDPDVPCSAATLTLARDQALLTLPLSGADSVGTAEEGTNVVISATNGDYYAASNGTLSGYIPKDAILSVTPVERFLGRVEQLAPQYAKPLSRAANGKTVARRSLVYFDAQGNGFYRMAGTDVFLPESCISVVKLTELSESRRVYWPSALHLNAGSADLPLTATIPAYTLITVTTRGDAGYLVSMDGVPGFADAKTALDAPDASKAGIAALTKDNAVLLSAPQVGAAPTGVELLAGVPVWLRDVGGGFYQVIHENHIGYFAAEAMTLLSADTPCASAELYLDGVTTVYDFPFASYATAIGSMTGNQLLRVTMVNGNYAKVSLNGTNGYIRLSDTARVEEAGSGAPAVLLHVDKTQHLLTAYALDENGARTETVLRTITPALGKRSTPTPTGEFTLGSRERWHYFGPSFSPFAISYTRNRYLHGPLYASRSENTVKRSHLNDFGHNVTGGCVRMPYDDALWIYMHCPAGTQLVITNGPLE